MKQCPYCHSELEDSARFCLYCMRDLEPKRKMAAAAPVFRRKTVWIAALAVLLAAGVALALFFVNRPTPPIREESETVGAGLVREESGQKRSGSFAASGSSSRPTASEELPADPGGTAYQPSSGGQGSTDTSRTPSPKVSSSPKTSSAAVSSAAPSYPAVTYTYRDAKAGDDFAYYANIDNAVVITGVAEPTPTGIYYVPATIDGKRVIAIGSIAFSNASVRNGVKQVIVADGVRTIQIHAFDDCVNMTDIWFYGKSVYTHMLAFCESSDRAGTLTIHCSADCEDRNFHLYQNSAELWHAVYEEWNG